MPTLIAKRMNLTFPSLCVSAIVVFGLALLAGSATAQGKKIDLAKVDGQTAFGVSYNALAGRARWFANIGTHGDLNGDGFDDIALGLSILYTPIPGETTGEVYVVYGSDTIGGEPLIKLRDLTDRNGLVIRGVAPSDNFGSDVTITGDLNADGYADLAISASGVRNPNGTTGAVYVVFGGPQLGTGILNVDDLDSSRGFLIYGSNPTEAFGSKIWALGDVNADQVDDLLIGSPSTSGAPGHAYVLFGASDVAASGNVDVAGFNGKNGFAIAGTGRHFGLGRSGSAAGDLNDDGTADLVVWSKYLDTHIIYGGPNIGRRGVVRVPRDLTGARGFTLPGLAVSDHTGISVAALGDITGDGIDDLMVGSPSADKTGQNKTEIRHGQIQLIYGDPQLGASGTFDLRSLDGQNGMTLNGIDDKDRAGNPVSSAGDFNGDGVPDLLMTAFFRYDYKFPARGESYLVFGGSSLFGQTIFELSNLDGNNGFAVVNTTPNSRVGTHLASLGDINNDGFDDVWVGSFDEIGTDYVLLGRETPLTTPLTCQGRLVTVDLNFAEAPTNGDDVILGTAGDDVIIAKDGDDIVCGGDGNDRIAGGEGNDLLVGENGADVIYGSVGDDKLIGGPGADTLNAGAGDDKLYGGTGDDRLRGNSGSDQLDGNAGSDSLNGGMGDDVLRGGSGKDLLRGLQGNDELFGGAGEDQLYGAEGTDKLNGGAGNDKLYGGADNDSCDGGSGNDVEYGCDVAGQR